MNERRDEIPIDAYRDMKTGMHLQLCEEISLQNSIKTYEWTSRLGEECSASTRDVQSSPQSVRSQFCEVHSTADQRCPRHRYEYRP